MSSCFQTSNNAHLRSLVLLVAVGAGPVSGYWAGLRALEATGLLQGRQAPRESTLMLTPLAWLRRRAWLLTWWWRGRHLSVAKTRLSLPYK